MTTAQPKTDAAPPVERIRVGLVQASIWKKQGEFRPYYEVTFQRSYRDADDKWHNTRSFTNGYLLALAKAADLAHTRIVALQQHDAPAAELPDDDGG